MEGGLTALQLAQGHLRAGIATLIRNTSRQSKEEERRRKEENRQIEEEEKRQKETRRQREEEARLRKEEERRKEETDFCRVWREPIDLLGKAKGNERKSAFVLRRPWMQEIKETVLVSARWRKMRRGWQGY
jgi:hypothetical protein